MTAIDVIGFFLINGVMFVLQATITVAVGGTAILLAKKVLAWLRK